MLLSEVLCHPTGRHFFSLHAAEHGGEPGSAAHGVEAALAALGEIQRYRHCLVPETRQALACEIFSSHIKESGAVPAELKAQLAEQVDAFDFAAEAMFAHVEDLFTRTADGAFAAFKEGEHFKQLLACLGPKLLLVRRTGDAAPTEHVLSGRAIVGRGDAREDGRQYIQLWREGDDGKVSREHCRIDVGPLCVRATDLGSSKGTRLDAANGPKITSQIIAPQQSLHMGAYTITYVLRERSAARSSRSSSRSSSGGIFSRMSSSMSAALPRRSDAHVRLED